MSHFGTQEEMVKYRERVWAEHTYVFSGFRFLWVTGQVWIGDIECQKLTETEADILRALIKSWPKPLNSKQLLAALSIECWTAPKDMKVWIRRIRQKIGVYEIITSSIKRGWSFNPEAIE